MRRQRHPVITTENSFGILAFLGIALSACSGSSSSNDDSSVGGSTDIGVENTGGTVSVTTATSPLVGGTSSVSTVGQAGSSSGSGGSSTSGTDTLSGGTLSTGGVTSAGGTTAKGGTSSTGGVTSTGGTTAKGGTSSTGGVTSTGGTTTKGGTSSTGGVTSTGGTTAKGGTSSTGGVTSTGGTTATGGTSSTACPGETSGVMASKIVYVSPTGVSTNSGATSSAPKNLAAAISAVLPGEMLLLAPGTYTVAYTAAAKNTLVLSKAGTAALPIKIVAANCGRAVIDFSFPEQAWVQDSFGFSLTGNYYYFKGLDITRAGYQGVYVTGQHNTFENCTFHDNRNTGLEINKGGAYTTVLNCDAYRNYDPKKFGGMSDGFGPKQTQGPGNKFIGCRAWENSDDGYDAFDSPETVTFENCWAFRNGVDVWNYGNFAGNGNGFKIGGNGALANHKLTQCVSFGNVVKGFDQNNNTGGLTLFNCTGYQNGTNYGLGGTLATGQTHVLKNNISLSGGTNAFGSATQQNNSWNSGFSVTATDFASLVLSQATIARNLDGSLQKTTLFRLNSSSKLVNAGVNIGLTYVGTAPDLGAFEIGQ